jgi:transglutaminase-like putative cysteine protease
MRNLVREGKRNPANRDLSAKIRTTVPAKNWIAEIRALFNWVRSHIRYTLDTNEIEVLQAPDLTVKLGYGDCDDMCILLATLLECAGHPARFNALGFDPRDRYFSHVVVETTGAGETPWIMLDPTEKERMGWRPPNIRWQMIADI